LRIIKFQVFYI